MKKRLWILVVAGLLALFCTACQGQDISDDQQDSFFENSSDTSSNDGSSRSDMETESDGGSPQSNTEAWLTSGYYTYETNTSTNGLVTAVVEIDWYGTKGAYYCGYYDKQGNEIHLNYGTSPSAVNSYGEYSIQDNGNIRFHELGGVNFNGNSMGYTNSYWLYVSEGSYVLESDETPIAKMPLDWTPEKLIPASDGQEEPTDTEPGADNQREFDETQNSTFSICGIDFSIPAYYELVAELSTDTVLWFFADVANINLIIGEPDFGEVELTQEEINSEINSFADSLITDMGYDDAELLDIKNTSFAGFSGSTCTVAGTFDNKSFTFCVTLAYNSIEGKAVRILFVCPDGTPYNYLADYDKIIESAKLS